MTNFQEHLSTEPVFATVAQGAEALGYETYAIGGYVRDLLLKRNSKDLDFVCVGSGIALAEKVAELIGGGVHVNVFKNFGTAMIRLEDGRELEFVGARKESYQRHSRKPVVEDGSLTDDQNRRDFTINALAISLNKRNFGDLIDPFDGVKDLKRKIIRTPLDPNITFSDDPLRMLRAIRFATQLDFDIAPDTYDAIGTNIDRMQIVSKERITDELNKIIMAKKPSYGFKLLFSSGLLQEIFPEMVKLHGVDVINGKAHKDNFYHTLQVLDNTAAMSDDLWLRWAAILHDIAKPATKAFHPKVGWTFHGHEDKGARMVPGIFKEMRLPLNEKMKFVQKLVKLHLRPIALAKKTITDSAIRRVLFEAGEDIDALMTLCRADITSKNLEKKQRFLDNFDLVEKRMKEVEESDQIRNFQPPITGEMIMEIFDLKPGKVIGEIKDAIKEAIIEGKIKNDYHEAYALMLELAKHHGLELKNKV